jgi:hypothetical protein
MGLVLFTALNTFFAVAVVTAWRAYSGSPKSGSRRVGYRREEIEIDAADIPHFKPTWPNAK